MQTNQLSFTTDPGTVLDRILTIYANSGRDIAFGALTNVVRQDVQENAKGSGYTPRTLLWYVVGVRVTGDPSFYVEPAFVKSLALSEKEAAMYSVHVSGIELFRSKVGDL